MDLETGLQKIINPYRVDQIPDSKNAFFGREEIVTWLEQQIIAQRRVLLLHGTPLIGKTTFLKFLPQMLTLNNLFISFSFGDLPDYSHNAILLHFLQQLTGQLTEQGVIRPQNIATATDVVSAIDRVIALVEERRPSTELIVSIDDLDALLPHPQAEIDRLLDICQSLLTRHDALQMIFMVNSISVSHLRYSFFDSAPVQQIGPLELNDALKLITQPVDKTIRFDYGVPKRIAELNSNHPYYLTLFNRVLFARCAREGWVNLRHIDETLDEVLIGDIPSFQQIWDESTWVERAALAAMGAAKGSHGVLTRQEVFALLRRTDKKVDEGVVLTALESLSFRGVLVKMGALSYRFYIDLFRFWLQRHADLSTVLRNVSWQTPAARPEPVVAREVAGDKSDASETPGLKWPLWVLGLVGLLIVGLLSMGFVIITDKLGVFATPAPIVEAVGAAAATETPVPQTPTITPTPAPTGTPTPTPPIVIAKTLPSIAYMARQTEEEPWQIYVMDTDGSNPAPLLQSAADDTSPVWSPSGRQLAFVSQRDGNREIYVVDIDGQNLKNISNHPSDDWTPAWSPDGTQIAFSSNRSGNWDVFVVTVADGSLVQLTFDDGGDISPVWSPDGEKLAFSTKRDGNWEIYTMLADGSDMRRLTHNDVNDLGAVWSPDGAFIAYETNIDGNVEVYVMTAQGGNPRNVSNTSYANDHGPVWSPDSQRLLFYSNREGNWDLFVTDANGGNVANLTNTPDIDEQTPVWRP